MKVEFYQDFYLPTSEALSLKPAGRFPLWTAGFSIVGGFFSSYFGVRPPERGDSQAPAGSGDGIMRSG
jgi:hypothetical protein